MGVLWKYFRETLRFPLIWRPGPLSVVAEGGADALDRARDGLRWLLDQYIPELCDDDFVETHAVSRAVRRWYGGSSPSLRQLAADSYMIYRLGGRPAGLERVLGWMGIDAVIVEAHNQSPPLPPFFFDVVLEHYPGDYLDDLMRAVMAFKPARSWISSIRQPDCLPRMVLDYSRLDEGILSDVAGWMEDNIKWCFLEGRDDWIVLDGAVIREGRERAKALQSLVIWADLVDYMVLGEPEFILNPEGRRSTWRGFGIDYPAPEPETYHWRTFACQQVLSDYGALSGGEGFIDYFWQEPEEAQGILSETLILSDQERSVKIPITEFFRRRVDVQEVQPEPPAPAVCRHRETRAYPSIEQADLLDHMILGEPATVFNPATRHTAASDGYATLVRTWTGDWTAGNWKSPYTLAAKTEHTEETA